MIQPKQRKRQFRFSGIDDVALLTPSSGHVPSTTRTQKDGKKVPAALRGIGIDVDHRRCQQRTNSLVDNFRRAENESKDKPAVDEGFPESNKLLTDLAKMLDNLDEKIMEASEKKKRKLTEEQEIAELIRTDALKDLRTKKRSQGSSSNSIDDEKDGSSEVNGGRSNGKHRKSGVNELRCVIEASNKAILDRWEEEKKLRNEELELTKRKLDMEEADRKVFQQMMLAVAQALVKKSD
jgi:hypothetical protein